MSNEIAQQWLLDAAATANAKDYDAYMDLISKRVSVTGIPGYENIGYDEWATQCKHEFDNNLLKKCSLRRIQACCRNGDIDYV